MPTLAGVKIVEFAALGPAAYATMLLADMGADVIRIERPQADPAYQRDYRFEHHLRGRRSITLDLRHERGQAVAMRLIRDADVVVDAGRPGGMERFNLGPDECMKCNPRLVYGRLTGWGQTGPRSTQAGHDINYIALTGALHTVGSRDGPPVPPLGLIGDFAGGAMFLALGICAALYEREHSGLGDVIDAAMVDGAASLLTPFFGQLASGEWQDRRGSNRVDGGAPFYRSYECADGRYIAIGAIEQRFFELAAAELGVDVADFGSRFDRDAWPRQTELLERLFRAESRDHWARLFASSDACVTPVLSLAEAPADEHLQARGTFVSQYNQSVPAPAPRFSRSSSEMSKPPVEPGTDATAVLRGAGYADTEIDALVRDGIVHLLGEHERHPNR